MNNASDNLTTAQRLIERHEPWCNREQHDGDLAEYGYMPCYGHPFAVGKVGGWLTDTESADGSTKIAIDWRPAEWDSLTLREAADLLGFLAKALAEVAAR